MFGDCCANFAIVSSCGSSVFSQDSQFLNIFRCNFLGRSCNFDKFRKIEVVLPRQYSILHCQDSLHRNKVLHVKNVTWSSRSGGPRGRRQRLPGPRPRADGRVRLLLRRLHRRLGRRPHAPRPRSCVFGIKHKRTAKGASSFRGESW